jgi:uncharacterized membrane protein
MCFQEVLKVNKESFLQELRRKLTVLSSEEREAAITYYEEYFNDAGLENEQSVLNELGSVDKVVNGILKENNYPIVDSGIKENSDNKYNKEEQVKPNVDYGMIALIVIATIFLAPIILPIFFAIFGVLVGFLFAGIGIIIAGVAVSAMGLVALFLTPMNGLLIFGLGLVLFSTGVIITTFMVNICAIGIPSLVRAIVRVCKIPFQKGGINI